MIGVKVRYLNKLTDIERRLALPLVEVAEALVPRLRARIRSGRNADGGSFRPLGADSQPTDAKGLFWVPPTAAQPAGYVIKAPTGKYAGWAGYTDYRSYVKATGAARDFYERGDLLGSMSILVRGSSRVRVYFKGSRKTTRRDGSTSSVRTRDIAWFNSRKEPVPLLTPERADIAVARDIVVDEVNRQLLEVGIQGAEIASRRDAVDRRSKQVTTLVRRTAATGIR